MYDDRLHDLDAGIERLVPMAEGERPMTETPASEADLCGIARRVTRQAYAPYSGYRVGAAVLADDRVFTGVNVENSAFPSTVCAERIALGAAVTAGLRDRIVAIAIAAEADDARFAGTAPRPCGVCLQWFAELAPDIRILVCDTSSDAASTNVLRDFLRQPFAT